ncbi:hypothetical protein [Nitrospira lenta]|uniref:Uncharacterized protein n=1 Tax=Nitrospira lenta TaxID=1436998 RepID=A0A330LAA7_9BACT|nr:hypothetical protein [Nitrospira lenta]SPP66208.1 membrane hypothetical protein [Nitrospira lenta]
MQIEFFIAIANLLFCLQRLLSTFRSGRLSAVVWALAAYFSFFFIFVLVDGPFSKHRGFTNDTLFVKQETIDFTCYYIATFHLIFAFTEWAVWKLLGIPASRVTWELPRSQKHLSSTLGVLLAFLCIGGSWYWWKMQGLGYQDYVEGTGSNWPQVFLWASSPFITISMMQRRYWAGALAGIPFILFAIMLNVRSFALLSLVPAVIIGLFHMWQESGTNGYLVSRLIKASFLLLGLFLLSAAIMQQKGAHIGLPDSDMAYGVPIIVEAVQQAKHYTEFNSLEIYGLNLINPFLKLFGLERPHLIDTPVYMASLIDGVPKDWPVYFHYPTLWYSDAYISFGIAGLVLATLWALILTGWEAFMLRYPTMIALMLPYYVWHAYMLVRGAPGIASVPFSYAFYVSALVFLLSGGRRIWATPPTRAAQNSRFSETLQSTP